MKISALTDIGLGRDSNQDALKFNTFDTGDCYAIVCDGMGGVSGGQIASAICIERVANAVESSYRKNMSAKSAKNLLQSAITAANASIHDKSQNEQGLRGMGTTIVAVLVIGKIAVIAHVGDSRAYYIDENISQVTKDHSLVQLMIDNKKITPEEAKTHPDRNIITRAVGVVNFVDVEFDIIDFNKGDKILLCSDGLSGSLENEEILNIIKKHTNSSVEELVKKAIENGSGDNITAVLIQGE